MALHMRPAVLGRTVSSVPSHAVSAQAAQPDRFQPLPVRSCLADERLPRGTASSAGNGSSTARLRIRTVQQPLGVCRTASSSPAPVTETGGPGGNSGNGAGGGGNGFGGSGGDAGEGEGDDDRLLNLEQAEQLAAASGVKLPTEFIAAATAGGLRSGALRQYISLQGSQLLGWLSRAIPAVRDRLLADPRYLFIVFSEVAIDSGCATVAEVRKRGADFWDEFEFYLSDLVVGCVLDVVLVSLMAPVATIGAAKPAMQPGWRTALSNVPSAVFEPSKPGRRFTLANRTACIGVKFLEYSLAGIVCGFIGQGIANSLMRVKRRYHTGEGRQLDIPPLGMTALTWGFFMGVSSNLRYQAVFGLERMVDKTIARRIPQVAYFTTFAFRFLNNVIGGENFIDTARWTGIQ